MTKASDKPSTKSSAPAPAKTAKAVKDTPVKTAASKPVAKAPPPPPASTTPAKKETSAAKKTSMVAPAKSATPPAPAQASPQTVEAAVLAKPVAPARSPSKISTPDHMSTTATKVDSKLANAWKTKTGRELTEPELMAMPEAEYMNEKQLDFFRGRLTVLKDDLLSNAGETTEHLREDTSIVPDPADRATIEEEHALELRTRDRERKLLKKISQALTRLDSGEYGYCDETGEPIGLGRLIARPTATLSLEAQQRRELKQKMFGD
ncbi:MAG: RNA polymerase-binding protein DksA [Aquabacterium sp.]|nr:RNA polymerase-binding protein DksA [Aquabacterium sp.]MDO9003847.1 RNA polymerase-binding protein DksA [Aquabacterium sp.]